MNVKSNWLSIFALIFITQTGIGQPVFKNKTKQFKKDIPTRSVMPGAMLDIDGDLVDDIVLVDKGIWLKAIQSYGRQFNLHLIDSLKVSSNPEWTITAGDMNNDGKPEMITSGLYNLISINTFSNNKFTKKAFQSGIYAQASNTVDINNDGWLDYFVCNDDGPSSIYINDKTGNLLLTNVIDFMKNDSTDGSGNYGSEWVDVNGDLLPDLCISKCRAGVNNPADLRRINRLYINNGNGTFTERAGEFRLNSGEQSWVTAFGDIDNDGDQDAFVVNHYAPHMLMENVDGKFFKEVPLPELMQSFGFQSVMRDFDNDGYPDIIIAGVEGVTYLQNKGNKKFEIFKNIIGPNTPRSLTVGDLDDDGFLDIHAHISEPINEIGVKDDELWLNEGNENNFIKINLEGKSSNRSGIGAQIEIYGVWGKQVRYVKGGESYGIFNSLQQHFGIGAATVMDSIVIRWPSGVVDKYLLPEANNTYLAQEGKCLSKSIDLYAEEQILTSAPILLEAVGQFDTYLWNNGSATRQVQITKQGKYHVTMTDAEGCKTISKPVSVISGCFTSDVKLIRENALVKLCAGEEIEISAVNAASYSWSNGSTTKFTSTDQTQKIILTAIDYCGNTKSDSISIEFYNIDFEVKGDTVIAGEKAILISDNDATVWYTNQNLVTPIFTGDTLITEILTNTADYFARVTEIIDKKIKNVGQKEFPLDNLYGGNGTVGGIIFSVERPCVLYSVKVNTDLAGVRKIIIKDTENNVIFSKEIYIDAGIHSLILNAVLNPGSQYNLTTDEGVNVSNFGYKSPRLVRTFNNTGYPYGIDNVVTLLSSPFGAIYYYYFYDWEVHFDIVSCDSEVKEVIAFVEMDSGAEDQEEEMPISIYPNPTTDKINIKLNENINLLYAEIMDIQGKKISKTEKNNTLIDFSGFSDGLYILNVYTDAKLFSFKIIKH